MFIILILLKRADGFYQAEVNGELGLVPGSFLDEYTTRVRVKHGKSKLIYLSNNYVRKLVVIINYRMYCGTLPYGHLVITAAF